MHNNTYTKGAGARRRHVQPAEGRRVAGAQRRHGGELGMYVYIYIYIYIHIVAYTFAYIYIYI